jgi:hypothetical protein
LIPVIAGLEGHLRDEWTQTFSAQWETYANATPLERSATAGKRGTGGAKRGHIVLKLLPVRRNRIGFYQ